MELKDVFDLVADAPAPPSRLDGAELFQAGRRRHRLALTAKLAGVAAAVVAVAVAAALIPHASQQPVVGHPSPSVAPPDPSHVVASDGNGPPVHFAPLRYVTAGDATHLYAMVAACNDCPEKLYGSDDGGAHWQPRAQPADAQGGSASPTTMLSRPVALGPQTLLSSAALGGAVVSTDGGRSWRAVTRSQTPVQAVPAGGTLRCADRTPTTACTVYAVDPATATEAPLAAQPPRARESHLQVLGGGLFAVSTWDDGATRPRVAISADRGATWTTHEFTDLPVNTGEPPGTRQPLPVSRDGRTVYLLIEDNKAQTTHTYRSTDAGAHWQRIDTGHSLPYALSALAPSVVLPDGTHVVETIGNDRLQLWTARDDGARYAAIPDPPGLPDRWQPIQMLGDGTFVTFGDTAVYRSADLQHWVTVQPPSS